ncbi:hypothetical protein D3C85_1663970 [compost metagenome]
MSDVIATIPSLFGNVYVLDAVFEFVKNEVKVFAAFLKPSLPARNVLIPDTF